MKKRKTAYLQALTGVETKRVVYERAGTLGQTVATANQNPTTENCLNWVAQGDSDSTRTGNDITLQCLKIKMGVGQSISPATDVPIENTLARVVIVLDKQPNRSAITPSNVFTETSNSGLSVYASRNWNFKDRYIILYDKYVFCRSYSVCPGTSGAFRSTRTRIPFDIVIDLSGIVVKFRTGGVGTGVGAINTNAISVLAWAVPGDGTRPLTTIDYVAQLEFVDGN